MKPIWLASLGVAALSLATVPVSGQSVISARSGLVHYVEGDVFLGDQKVEPKFGNYPDVKEKAVLRTELGRAEVLLNPGVFLRLGENSSFRMITNRLIDTRVDLLTGRAEVEADEIAKDTGVTIVCKDAAVTLRKTGVYSFETSPAGLRVYSGDAVVAMGGKNIEVGAGKTVAFEGDNAAMVAKFNKDENDALGRWSRRRGEMVAMANVSAAKSLHDSGYSLNSSVWQFNPYFGLMTFIPARGMLMSPYGYQYWSPVSVARVYYQPPPSYNTGGGFDAGHMGYATMAPTSGGYSGTATSMATSSSAGAVSHSGSTAAAAAPSSSVGHGSGGGGGRQR